MRNAIRNCKESRMNESVNETVAGSDTHATESDKEKNFAALRQKAERAERLAQEEKDRNEQLAAEIAQLKSYRLSLEEKEEDDDDDEPYVDKKKLSKVLSKFEKKLDQRAEEKARQIVNEEKKKNYLPRLKTEFKDYDEVMNDETIAKFTEASPEYAQQIMDNPDNYVRRKLAYHAIKSMKLHVKDQKPSMQELVEKNQQNPFYHPSSASYANSQQGDFSLAGQKNSYQKMRELQSRFSGR